MYGNVQLRDEVDAGCQPSLGEDTSIHDVAALLKEYFRDLPDPLLTRDLYSAFIATRSKWPILNDVALVYITVMYLNGLIFFRQ